MKYGIIIQARVGSSRRPGKVLSIVNNEELLSFQINRLRHHGLDNIIVATTTNIDDDQIINICDRLNVSYFRGSQNNLIERYSGVIQKYKIDFLIRVGGDDPLIDPDCIKALLFKYSSTHASFIYASHKYGWIYGTAAELIHSKIIIDALISDTNELEKEHIIPYINNNSNIVKHKIAPSNQNLIRPDIYLSVDYQEDLELVKKIIEHLSRIKGYYFTQKDIIDLYDSGIIEITNKHLHDGFSD